MVTRRGGDGEDAGNESNRIRGNTQDYALYNASLPLAINGTFNLSRSADYPTAVYIGPSFFEGYSTLPGTRFSHGFNLALTTSSAGWKTLVDTVPLLCEALAPETRENSTARSANGTASRGKPNNHRRLYTWEYGNEPDLLSTSAQGPTRAINWNESTYVAQWLNGTRQIRQLIEKHCPELVGKERHRGNSSALSPSSIPADYAGFMAPSFAGTNNHLKALATWKAGLDVDGNIALFSSHKFVLIKVIKWVKRGHVLTPPSYISGATSPGVTLQGTLMNHSSTVHSVDAHIAEYESIFGAAENTSVSRPRHILGETNSLYNEGKPGLSNAFGAALWGVDFLLYSAAAGLGRVHMHQGTNYRYASWQPVETDIATRGTKPPYYGNIAVAAALGNTRKHNVSVAALSPSGSASSASDIDSAYAVYVDGRLARVLVLNLRGYNTTIGGTGLGESAPASMLLRPSQNYTFSVPAPALGANDTRSSGRPHRTHDRGNSTTGVLVQRLLANGSDAITGIAWDGWSYNVELAGGKPVRLANVTTGERLAVQGGQVTVSVPDSSAALLHF